MFREFLMTIFSLWGWHHVLPEYKAMLCVILNSMPWVTVLTTVVSLTITSAAQRSYVLTAVIFLLATTLVACFAAKLVVEYAKAPLEAKAYAPRAKVLRDGSRIDVHADNFVPGDIIFLKVGDIVPANARVLWFHKIDMLTCWAKRSVDCVHGFLIYYAWTVSCGQGTAVVIATGSGIPRCTLRLYPHRYARPGQLKEGIMARTGIEVLEHHSRFFVALKLMFLTTYIDSNGPKWIINVAGKAVKQTRSMVMDNFALDGYQAIAVGHQVGSCWEYIGLLSFRDDLRSDSADSIDSLIDLGLDIRIPTDDNSDIVRRLRDFGWHCAMVGYEFLDHDAIGESNIGISVAEASDYTKSESDLVLTQPVLLPISSAVQISREMCQIMRGYTIYTVSSTVHLVSTIMTVGIHVILLLWNFNLPSFLALVIATFSYLFNCRCPFYLQMSIVNQAVLFVHSDNCYLIRCPGPVVACTFIFTQMVATHKTVYGDLDLALPKGVGCLRAGLIWLYNFVVLMTPVLICHTWRRANMTSEKLLTICIHSAILRIALLWSLYAILDVRLQQPGST
ncbi:Plasma membrane ATPase [Triticum urartu]|uniref:Plasma membrane ATPase n=1 Tax=Triticum urartu TaxID=4572 RepID=M7ZMR4_TRIUA|nr:Plasma membrane ATPase [Triticum urartu]